MNLAEHTVFRTSRFGITVEIANPSHFFRAYSEKGMPLNQIFDLYQSSGLMALQRRILPLKCQVKSLKVQLAHSCDFSHELASFFCMYPKRIRCSQNESEIYNAWIHHTSILTYCVAKDLVWSYIRKCSLAKCQQFTSLNQYMTTDLTHDIIVSWIKTFMISEKMT